MNKAKFAGVCVIKNGKILLVQELHKEARGLWSFPLGHVEDNEEETEAAIREAKEETGLDVILGKSKKTVIDGRGFKSTSNFNDKSITLTVFEAEIKGGVIKTGDDVLDVKWFSINDLSILSLRGDWMQRFIKF